MGPRYLGSELSKFVAHIPLVRWQMLHIWNICFNLGFWSNLSPHFCWNTQKCKLFFSFGFEPFPFGNVVQNQKLFLSHLKDKFRGVLQSPSNLFQTFSSSVIGSNLIGKSFFRTLVAPYSEKIFENVKEGHKSLTLTLRMNNRWRQIVDKWQKWNALKSG